MDIALAVVSAVAAALLARKGIQMVGRDRKAVERYRRALKTLGQASNATRSDSATGGSGSVGLGARRGSLPRFEAVHIIGEYSSHSSGISSPIEDRSIEAARWMPISRETEVRVPSGEHSEDTAVVPAFEDQEEVAARAASWDATGDEASGEVPAHIAYVITDGAVDGELLISTGGTGTWDGEVANGPMARNSYSAGRQLRARHARQGRRRLTGSAVAVLAAALLVLAGALIVGGQGGSGRQGRRIGVRSAAKDHRGAGGASTSSGSHRSGRRSRNSGSTHAGQPGSGGGAGPSSQSPSASGGGGSLGGGQLQPVAFTASSGSYTAPTGSYPVDIAPGERCWIEVSETTGGQVLWEGIAEPGQTVSTQATGSLRIVLGAASGAQVSVAKQALAFPPGYQWPFTVTLLSAGG